MSEERERSFKVTDHRAFTAEGDPKESVDSKDSATEPAPSSTRARPDEPPSESSPPPIDFASFLLSLGTNGMIHLGEIPDPATGQKAENLEGARHTIDLLAMLQKKTEGNLTPDESHLFNQLLYELRMKFVTKQKPIQL